MRTRVAMVVLILACMIGLAACEGTTTVMATQGMTVNVSASTVQVLQGFEVDPTTSPVRLHMTAAGLFAFDGENHNNLQAETRQNLQTTIRERFPNAQVMNIRQMTENGTTVLYVYIKKPGVND